MPRAVTQQFRAGQLKHLEIPASAPGERSLQVCTLASLISAGTERSLLDFGRANIIQKARQQPQRLGEVKQKLQTDGLSPTVDAIRSKLDTPTKLGYAAAGVVAAVGRGVTGFSVGDLVATNGPHAEVISVPQTLCAKAPDGVAAEHACFATVGSVALQGIRLAEARLGERFVVIGLGLVGLLAVQLLEAQGCSVLGIDVNEGRMKLAESFGARTAAAGETSVAAAERFSRGRGVDGVLICASTKSNDPVHHAAQMCRDRGRIVLVGVTGLELQRADFYDKELSFQVSRSYGPGRYDAEYETGHDYPVGPVRWTAGRNMEAVLDLIASGQLDIAPLITHEFPFEDAGTAYSTLLDDPGALGIVLRYSGFSIAEDQSRLSRDAIHTSAPSPASPGRVAVLGAGNFANQVLIPAVTAAGGHLEAIVSRGGIDAAISAERYGARRSSTDAEAVIADDAVDTVVVATRHDSHARYAELALRAGKHVFVEKPLVFSDVELDELITAYREISVSGPAPLLGVGFNRRFAPITVRMTELLRGDTAPKSMILTMNAGSLPPDHWALDPSVGGGRILGEAIHMIDLARYLARSPIESVSAQHLDVPTRDSASITLAFTDGSIATVHYFANGSKQYAKERVEVFASGRVLVNENFRTLRAYGFPSTRTMRLRKQDKGHVACMRAFLEAVRSGEPAPIKVDEIFEVHRAALAASE